MIEVELLEKKYNNHSALENFSIRVEDGELFGLVGPNGAGKTTLIKILATLQPPDCGTARIGGLDVMKEPKAIRALVGYLPDVPGLYQDMRVQEFLEFFADAFHLKEPRRRQAINRALEHSDLADRRDDFVEQLSFGMKQRLVLSKTLLHDPKVLILDEPATGLDPLARIQLRGLLKNLNREGITILLSSHILADLEDICTHVALIADGHNAAGPDGQSVLTLTGGAAVHSNLICEIEVAGDAQAAARIAADVPGARVLSVEGQRLRIELSANSILGPSLLQKMIEAGANIVYFNSRGPGLEERYRQAFDSARRGESK